MKMIIKVPVYSECSWRSRYMSSGCEGNFFPNCSGAYRQKDFMVTQLEGISFILVETFPEINSQ